MGCTLILHGQASATSESVQPSINVFQSVEGNWLFLGVVVNVRLVRALKLLGLDNRSDMQVAFLRMALGSAAVPCPQIDVGPAFAAIMKAALGPANMNMSFSAYDNDLDFLLGEPRHLFTIHFHCFIEPIRKSGAVHQTLHDSPPASPAIFHHV